LSGPDADCDRDSGTHVDADKDPHADAHVDVHARRSGPDADRNFDRLWQLFATDGAASGASGNGGAR